MIELSQLINESITQSNIHKIEKYIYENWEDVYDKTHGHEISIDIDGMSVQLMGERWGSECIIEYLEKIHKPKEEVREMEYEEIESYLDDAIDSVVEEEKWNGFVYFDKEESGEEFGLTIFYRCKDINEKRSTEVYSKADNRKKNSIPVMVQIQNVEKNDLDLNVTFIATDLNKTKIPHRVDFKFIKYNPNWTLNGHHIKAHCDCKDWLYGGYKYIATQQYYSLEPETIRPVKKNPLLKGSACKHMLAIINKLPALQGIIKMKSK